MSGKAYTHNQLWWTADHLFDLAQDDEEAPDLARVGALLLTHAAFEAYLNHLGEIVASEAWLHEREFFTRVPHRGTLGKLRYLWDMLLGCALARGRRPYQSVRQLDRWRHKIAHGRTVDMKVAFKRTRDGIRTQDDNFFLSLAGSGKSQHVRDDVLSLCRSLHGAALTNPEHADHLQPVPFSATLSHASDWVPARCKPEPER